MPLQKPFSVCLPVFKIPVPTLINDCLADFELRDVVRFLSAKALNVDFYCSSGLKHLKMTYRRVVFIHGRKRMWVTVNHVTERLYKSSQKLDLMIS